MLSLHCWQQTPLGKDFLLACLRCRELTTVRREIVNKENTTSIAGVSCWLSTKMIQVSRNYSSDIYWFTRHKLFVASFLALSAQDYTVVDRNLNLQSFVGPSLKACIANSSLQLFHTASAKALSYHPEFSNQGRHQTHNRPGGVSSSVTNVGNKSFGHLYPLVASMHLVAVSYYHVQVCSKINFYKLHWLPHESVGLAKNAADNIWLNSDPYRRSYRRRKFWISNK